jgi:hypothetical protein
MMRSIIEDLQNQLHCQSPNPGLALGLNALKIDPWR